MLIIALTITASLSPLFTTAHLFQMKEWRWDRLREHVRSEGLRQTFGTNRPIVVAIMLALLLVTGYWLLVPSTLGILTALNIVQLFLKKQPYPVWTRKAVVLATTSTFLAAATSYGIWGMGYGLFLVILPLLQPIFLLAAWIVWKPVDALLKHRILTKTKNLRTQFPNLTVIGITGSAGKTTTKELLAHILGPERAIATPEHVNSELGVAQWLIKNLTPNTYNLTPIFVVEMGAYRQGEIATICAIAQPTMGIITNIGTQHIGLFGSQRAIAEAKGELFAALPASGHAFMKSDTPFAQELQKKCICPVTTVSTSGSPADLQATHIEETPDGLSFRLSQRVMVRRACLPDRQAHHDTSIQQANITIPLHGEHQLGSVLLAIAAAEKLGMTLENIAQRCKTFQPPSHTFSLREESGITILDDTHNASPESLRAAIEWARHQPYAQKILITPGIIEQGLTAARLHFQCGVLAKDVFDEAFILNKKFAQYFEQGFGKPVSSNLKAVVRDPEGSSDPERESYNLKAGTLLACVGRIPQSTIQKFLP